MLFDEVLFGKLNIFAKGMCEAYNIAMPTDQGSLVVFFSSLSKGIKMGEGNSSVLGLALYYFASSESVRDRKTTGKTFEDIFGAITGAKVEDVEFRINPPSTDVIRQYDSLCKADWKISTDYSGNKREKGDHRIEDYVLSIKTLKGKLYGRNGELLSSKFNDEINVGSFSFRSLFLNLVSDKLGDRKAGLGSSKQTIPILEKIKEEGNLDEFKKRITLFMDYVYSDDILVVFKCGYKMRIILIPAKSFRDAIVTTLDEPNGIQEFTSIWYRWENNNLRIKWKPLHSRLISKGLPMSDFILDFHTIFDNKEFMKSINAIKNSVDEGLDEVIKSANAAIKSGQFKISN